MKYTYKLPIFSDLLEYSERQLADATPAQKKAAMKRLKAREGEGGKGTEGSAEAPIKQQPHQGSKEKRRRQKQGNAKGFQGDKSIVKGSRSNIEKRTKSTAITKTRKAPTSTDIVRVQKSPDNAKGKSDRVAQGGAIVKYKGKGEEENKKTGGVKNYGAKKKLVKTKRVAGKVGKGLQVAGKVAKEVGKVAKAAISGTNDAFGKSKWEHTELKTYQEFMIECRHARK